jgi:hypothetical protein
VVSQGASQLVSSHIALLTSGQLHGAGAKPLQICAALLLPQPAHRCYKSSLDVAKIVWGLGCSWSKQHMMATANGICGFLMCQQSVASVAG